MHIQFLNGGLANQVFQYIFYRSAQLLHPNDMWYLDDSFFFVNNVHNGYELEKVFGLTPNLLSQFFDDDVWDYMISLKREQNISIPEIMRQNGETVQMIAETSNWKEWNPFNGDVHQIPANEFHPEIQNISGGVIYYHGYWINRKWFGLCTDTLQKELVFPPLEDALNLSLAKQITSSNSCSIHIRRGDYVTLGFSFRDEDFAEMIRNMLAAVPDITLFVFSDDIDYCKSHAKDIGLNLPKQTVYVTGNSGTNAYRDMQLMSLCKNMILSNSAFCYLAALLNKDLHATVNPTSRELS